MKSTKALRQLFDQVKNPNRYYSFDNFLEDAKAFINDVKKRNTTCSIKPARSGMSRKFNFVRYNVLLNIVYNQKYNSNYVSVGGCGMDIHWLLKFSTCQALMTKTEIEKNDINLRCSSGTVL